MFEIVARPFLSLCLLCVVSVSIAQAGEVRYPPDVFEPVEGTTARIIDVTRPPYRADNTGKTSATAAIQKAISENIGRSTPMQGGWPMTLYFPSGTYLIDDTLKCQDTTGKWTCFLVLQGQSREGVVIRLKDKAPGFADPAKPKGMIVMTNRDGTLTGNSAFANYIDNMTFDVGSGNAGAMGIDYLASNDGSIRNVTIRSSDPDGAGLAGLSMMRDWPGPLMLKNIEVSGFDYGVRIEAGYYNVVIEDLVLKNQRVAGLRTDGTIVSARKITSDNRVPVIQSTAKRCHFTLLDSQFKGGDGQITAIENSGVMFLRDVSAEGSSYAALLSHNGQALKGLSKKEWVSEPTTKLFADAPEQSMRLEVKDTPEPPLDLDFSHWANVMDKQYAGGANPEDYTDDHDAIQAAMNSGKPVVYLPPARRATNRHYSTNRTIVVPGTVKHIVGMSNYLYGGMEVVDNSIRPSQCLLRFNNPAGTTVVVDRLRVGIAMGGPELPMAVQLAGAGTVVFRDCNIQSITNAPGAGPLFIDNMAFGFMYLGYPQKVWARQLNPECGLQTKVTNIGGDFWVLGLKTESQSCTLANFAGARTEIMGGMFMSTHPLPNAPLILNDRAALCATFATTSTGGENLFHQLLHQRVGDEWRTLNQKDGHLRDGDISNSFGLMNASSGPVDKNWKPDAITPVKPIAPDSPQVPRDGLAQWLRADGAMETDGYGRVMRWIDASGKRNECYSDFTIPAPRLLPKGMNERPGISFDHALGMFAQASLSPSAEGWTGFIAFKTPASLAGKRTLVHQGYELGLDVILDNDRLKVTVAGKEPGGEFWQAKSIPPVRVTTSPLQAGTVYVVSYTVRGGTAAAGGDGTLSVCLNDGAPLTAKGIHRGMRWPNQDAAFATNFGGMLGEIIQFNKPLNEQAMSQVTAYLMSKYAIKP